MTKTDQARRYPRWLWLVLALSLGLNLVAGGIMAGRYLRKMEMRELGWFNSRILERMPESARDRAREALMVDREARLALRAELTKASASALAAFSAEPFDRAALAEALQARDDLLARRRALRAERVIGLAEALPAAIRAKFAERVAPRLEERRARVERRLEQAPD